MHSYVRPSPIVKLEQNRQPKNMEMDDCDADTKRSSCIHRPPAVHILEQNVATKR